MGRTRRSPAQKAASAKALLAIRERRLNKLGLPSTLLSSHPPVPDPNPIYRSNPNPPPPKVTRRKPKDVTKPVAVRSPSQRAQKQNELKLAREREGIAALERDLQDALRRESELREKVKTLKERCREEERGHHQDAPPHEGEGTNNTIAAPDGAFE